MRYSISDYFHYVISSQLIDCKTVLDMGGTGKMKNKGFEVTNANLRYGIDATQLPFKNNSFDASVSVVVLEHVGKENKQIQFINESVRVAKKKILHWIPIHKEVEKILAKLGHNHPCILPSERILKYLKEKGFQMIDHITVREHLINLTMIYPKLSCKELYNYAYRYKNDNYGILMELKKET